MGINFYLHILQQQSSNILGETEEKFLPCIIFIATIGIKYLLVVLHLQEYLAIVWRWKKINSDQRHIQRISSSKPCRLGFSSISLSTTYMQNFTYVVCS